MSPDKPRCTTVSAVMSPDQSRYRDSRNVARSAETSPDEQDTARRASHHRGLRPRVWSTQTALDGETVRAGGAIVDIYSLS
ncbi:hypothetical protein LSAT2_010751 [Lamellibrachia satsuma]|nr:hypothetical protein LSAT2_010751 [Lamellibrachia satsuma]